MMMITTPVSANVTSTVSVSAQTIVLISMPC